MNSSVRFAVRERCLAKNRSLTVAARGARASVISRHFIAASNSNSLATIFVDASGSR